ncbi:hypothetical protein K2X89_00090 [Myxococcota bacterium]|nr:hypothetical protein [Myxococcota bacterium]
MQTLLATVVVLGLVMAAMAIGVIVSGRRLRGSCGRECPCSEETRRDCALAAERGSD